MSKQQPRMAIATPTQIPAEDVRLYRWFCKECHAGGTLIADRADPPEHMPMRVMIGHNRKSPRCRWNEDNVTICRLSV